jgi:acetoin utilization deacetylase AcuC-like enzyme
LFKIAWSPVYRYELPEGHRFPMAKYDLLPEQLVYEGTADESDFFIPEQMSEADILLTHTVAYLTKLHTQTLSAKEIRNIGFPMTPALVTRGKHIANGTWMCAQYAMQHGVSLNIAGGTHHAYADRGEGFCIFNDIAIAANKMKSTYPAARILIIDLDVHQGNGTAKIFEDQRDIFTLSVHGAKNYPIRKEKSDLDIDLPDGTTDAVYMDAIKKHIPDTIRQFKPDFIFYLAGVDVLATDKLGRLHLSKQGCKERDKYVLSLARNHQIPVAVTMGGGYSPRISDILDAHANTFRAAREVFFCCKG